MKKIFLPLFLASAFTLQAQDVKEWLALTPIPVEKPAFSNMKNVRDKAFSEAMLNDYASINIQNLVPDTNQAKDHFHQLKWRIATTQQDTI